MNVLPFPFAQRCEVEVVAKGRDVRWHGATLRERGPLRMPMECRCVPSVLFFVPAAARLGEGRSSARVSYPGCFCSEFFDKVL